MYVPEEWLSCPDCGGDVNQRTYDDGRGWANVKLQCEECRNTTWYEAAYADG